MPDLASYSIVVAMETGPASCALRTRTIICAHGYQIEREGLTEGARASEGGFGILSRRLKRRAIMDGGPTFTARSALCIGDPDAFATEMIKMINDKEFRYNTSLRARLSLLCTQTLLRQ